MDLLLIVAVHHVGLFKGRSEDLITHAGSDQPQLELVFGILLTNVLFRNLIQSRVIS